MENVFEKLGLMPPGNDQPGTATSLATPSHYSWDLSALQTEDTVDAPWDTMSDTTSYHSDKGTNHAPMRPHNSADYGLATPRAAEDNVHAFLKNLAFPPSQVDFNGNRNEDNTPDKRGFQDWIKHRVGDEGPDLPSPVSSSQIPDHDQAFDDVTSPSALYPLPDIAEMMVLFLEYLENFNSICPLFKPLALLSICDENCSITPNQADRWACINVVLALAHTMRSRVSDMMHVNHQISRMFMKNALQVVSGLCLGPPTLWAAQALLGMVLNPVTTPNIIN